MHNIFISHSWAYGDAYDGLKQLLDSDPFFSYQDFSVPKDDPIHFAANDRELALAIATQMNNADVVIVLAGVYATYSKWINNELAIAKRGFVYPKPILAVQLWGAERTSSVVKESADQIVGWNSKSITTGIQELKYGRSAYR